MTSLKHGGQLKKINLGLLYGGTTHEHDVSLRSAAAIYKNLNKERYNIQLVGITRDGVWHLQEKAHITATEEFGEILQVIENPREILFQMGNKSNNPPQSDIFSPEVIFPAIHGDLGEDGSLQGLCQALGIACVGADIRGSVVALDKALTKSIIKETGIPLIPYLEIDKKLFNQDAKNQVDNILKSLGPKIFIKPSSMGSSIGCHLVTNPSLIIDKLSDAFNYGNSVIVEKALDVREIECAVLEQRNGLLRISVLGEMVHSDEFFNYHAKYISEDLSIQIPAKIDPNITESIREYAKEAFLAMGLKGMARMDFFLTESNIYFNEVNTIPGFTDASMYPKLFEHEGLSYSGLLDELIQGAIEHTGNKLMRQRMEPTFV